MPTSLYGAAVRISTNRARQTISVFTAVGHSSICIRSTSTAEKGAEQDELAHDPYLNSPVRLDKGHTTVSKADGIYRGPGYKNISSGGVESENDGAET